MIVCTFLQSTTIIDYVDDGMKISNDKIFYGLYGRSLAQRCWSPDSQYVFLSSPQKNTIKSYIVNIGNRAFYTHAVDVADKEE